MDRTSKHPCSKCGEPIDAGRTLCNDYLPWHHWWINVLGSETWHRQRDGATVTACGRLDLTRECTEELVRGRPRGRLCPACREVRR